MFVRHPAPWIIAVAMMAGAGSAMALTPVRISTPEPDSTVRGRVPIKVPVSAVPASSPTPGYVIINIDGKFQAAVARPKTSVAVTYVWDTMGTPDTPGSRVSDGKHEIKASVVAQDGKLVGGTDRVEVFVQNAVRTPPSQVALKYQFTPGTQRTWTEKIQIRQNDQEIYRARVIMRITADDLLAGNVAMLRERIDQDSAQAEQGQPAPLMQAGQTVSFNALTNGGIIPGMRMRRTGQKPVMVFPLLPPTPVKVGDTWTAPVSLSPMFQGLQDLRLPAETSKHTLQGFEWQDGYPTARILTSFMGTAQMVVLGTPAIYRVSGTRTTYFDWRKGIIVKMVDEYTMNAADPTQGIGTFGSSSINGAPPGYSPGTASPGASAVSGANTDYMKVTAVTQLSG